jgi:hypothetical protein
MMSAVTRVHSSGKPARMAGMALDITDRCPGVEMAAMITDLVDSAHPESGTVKLSKRPVALRH